MKEKMNIVYYGKFVLNVIVNKKLEIYRFSYYFRGVQGPASPPEISVLFAPDSPPLSITPPS